MVGALDSIRLALPDLLAPVNFRSTLFLKILPLLLQPRLHRNVRCTHPPTHPTTTATKINQFGAVADKYWRMVTLRAP